MYNSYIHIEKELDEFVLDADLQSKDYMRGSDISWVAQVKPFIKQFSNVGDLVFDPFAGLGTTLIGAGLLGRRSFGLEIDKSRFDELQKRIDRYKYQLSENPIICCGDALLSEYPKEIDLILTNFPYFHATPISEKGNIYSVENYEVYLKLIEEVIVKSKATLKKNGYMIVFTENIRLANGNMLPQAYDICKLMQKHFNLKEERIVLYSKPEIAVNDPTYTNRSHEYVFISKQKEFNYNNIEYGNILKKIAHDLQYVAVGTYALMLHPEGVALDNPPSDLDIFVPNSNEAISAAHLLQQEGFTIYSWDDKVDSNFDQSKLEGRYYLRAIKDVGNNCIIDITYESDIMQFDNLYRNSIILDGQRIASVEDIQILLQSRNSDKDKNLVFRINEFRKYKNV